MMLPTHSAPPVLSMMNGLVSLCLRLRDSRTDATGESVPSVSSSRLVAQRSMRYQAQSTGRPVAVDQEGVVPPEFQPVMSRARGTAGVPFRPAPGLPDSAQAAGSSVPSPAVGTCWRLMIMPTGARPVSSGNRHRRLPCASTTRHRRAIPRGAIPRGSFYPRSSCAGGINPV